MQGQQLIMIGGHGNGRWTAMEGVFIMVGLETTTSLSNLITSSRSCRLRVLPLTRWCDRPLIFFFAISEAQKRGVQFFRHRTTLSAISRAVDGVEQQLNVPSHLTLPCASIGYSILALRRAPAELDPLPRCKFLANFLQISGRRRHWALYLAHIDPRRIDCVN
jgi:hypothetical protein